MVFEGDGRRRLVCACSVCGSRGGGGRSLSSGAAVRNAESTVPHRVAGWQGARTSGVQATVPRSHFPGSRGYPGGGCKGGHAPARRRLTVERCLKEHVSEPRTGVVCPLTIARPAVTNREQMVRRRRWRTKSDSGTRWWTSRKRGVQRIAPLSGVPCSLPPGGARGKRNFLGWLASRRQIRRQSEHVQADADDLSAVVDRFGEAFEPRWSGLLLRGGALRGRVFASIGPGRVRAVRGGRKFVPLSGGRRLRGLWGGGTSRGRLASRRQIRSLSENRRLKPTSLRPQRPAPGRP